MTTRSRVWRALGALAIVASMSHGAAASATSCTEPDPSISVVDAVLRLWDEPRDASGYALIGTVIEIRPADGGAGAGPTDVVVDVAWAFGVDAVPAQVVVSRDDPVLMNGYGFAPGATYFIPMRATGPDGRANSSVVCDPIRVLTDQQAAEIARRSLGTVAVTRPVDDPDATLPPAAPRGFTAVSTPATTAGVLPTEPTGRAGSSLPAIVATALICSGLLVLARFLWTRDDPPRRPDSATTTAAHTSEAGGSPSVAKANSCTARVIAT